MTQNTFPVPPVSAYDKWTPEKLKKNHPFFKRNVSFFFQFFFPRNNQTQEIWYPIFLAKVDDQPVAFASLIHLMSEKRDWGTPLSKSLLMAIHVQAWGSLCDPTTNHKITLAPFNF